MHTIVLRARESYGERALLVVVVVLLLLTLLAGLTSASACRCPSTLTAMDARQRCLRGGVGFGVGRSVGAGVGVGDGSSVGFGVGFGDGFGVVSAAVG